MKKLVSVIIPTYQRSDYLATSIRSILDQTYPEVEVIVIDDNAPDSEDRAETERNMATFAHLPAVRYVKNDYNMGGALSRNEGIRHAVGDYITFLDDDDIYRSGKIDSQVQYMEAHNLDLSFTNVRIHNTDDVLVDFRDHAYVTSLEHDQLLKKHIMHHLTPTATYMFKREALLSIGGFDNVKMGQEFMLMLKAIEHKLNIGYLPEANVIQYIHEGERISVGPNKLAKERELYTFKQSYFPKLTKAEQRYVKFRHHVVMAIAGKRSGLIKLSLMHGLKAVWTSPLDLVRSLKKHVENMKAHKD